ncbi:leucine-rich repeat domain-containing protein, partial [Blautia sp.]|uniref:leucine-rich repeat domain-containing protein n=1 Tax=Blautia sp. TaxID=1955243 RepID=UPI002A813AFC
MSYTLESLLNTTEGMEMVSSVKIQNTTVQIAGVDWFIFSGTVVNTIYFHSSHSMGLGSSTMNLWILRHSYGQTEKIYRQEGVLNEGIKFLKIRIEGHSGVYGTDYRYTAVYEVFLFDDGNILLYLINTPTSISSSTTRRITDGKKTVILTDMITSGITSDTAKGILIRNAGIGLSAVESLYTAIAEEGIRVRTAPSKTNYTGNAPDISDLVIESYDSSGNTNIVSNFVLPEIDSSEAGTKNYTVTYKTFLTEFSLTFTEDSVSAILSSGSMQDHYILGESVNVPNIYIQRLSGKKEFIYEGFEVTGFNSETSGTKTVTITYQGCTLEKTVYVAETATISVNDPKTSYLVGIEEFETPSVSVTYDDGATQYPDPECTGFDNSKLGTCTITVSARGLTTTYDVQITDTLTANIGAGTETDIVATLNVVTGLLSVQGTGETKEVTSGSWGSGGLFDDGGSSNQYAKEAVFGEGITGVYGVCQSMENLSKVTFPSTLTTIGAYSFYYCSSLTELTVPESVSVIGEYAFSSCSNLVLTILNSECQIADYSLEVKKIRAHTGSTANAYANNNGIEFESIDTIVSIEVTSLPYKTEYFTLAPGVDVSGMVITGTTDNGGTVEVIDYTVGEVDFSEPGQKTVTVAFGELTTQFEITVRNPSFDEINDTAA